MMLKTESLCWASVMSFHNDLIITDVHHIYIVLFRVLYHSHTGLGTLTHLSANLLKYTVVAGAQSQHEI